MTCHKIGMIARIRGAARLWVILSCWCLVAAHGHSATNAAASAVSAPRSQPIRLAVGGFTTLTDDANIHTNEDKLIDVLTAQLSQGGHFEMVERREIDSIAKEMSLSLADSQRTNAIKIGKILRADWLLVGSWSGNHGTNSIIAKILDVRTGVVLDLATFSTTNASISDFAGPIATFVENSAGRIARNEQRIFIGIGSFADLGINHRYPDFRKQLRAALENNYKGTRFTVVERTMVEPLLGELRLNLGGLAGTPQSAPTAQPAFLLVDGTYQSYQDEKSKINLILRVQEIGGGQRLYPLIEVPGADLEGKVIGILNGALGELRPTEAPASRKEEAIVQFNRGRERSRIEEAGADYHFLGGQGLGEEVRKQNVVEAIEAFQGSLLLDPDNARAKLYLAICLLDRAIGKVDDARNYLSEVIASGAEAATVDQARDAFVATYAGAEDAGVFELALEQGSAATDPIWRVAILNRGLGPMERLRRGNLFSNNKATEMYEQLYLAELAAFEKAPARQQFVFFDRSQAPFGQFESVTSNRADAERLLETFLPRAAQMYPGSAACIWVSYVVWRAKDTTPVPAPVVKTLRESLEWCRDHPEKISQPLAFYRAYIPPVLEWCAVNKEYSLGEIVWDIRDQAVAFDAKNNTRITAAWFNFDVSTAMPYYGAFCKMQLQKWAEALAILEKANSLALIRPAGPWGPKNTRMESSTWEKQCRDHLPNQPVAVAKATTNAAPSSPPRITTYGLKSANRYLSNMPPGTVMMLPGPISPMTPPGTLNLGTPVLSTQDRRTHFVCDGDLLWMTIGGVPSVCRLADGRLKTLPWPENVATDAHLIAVNQSYIWWGTESGGLVEMDKTTLQTKVYGVEDGLPLPHVTAMYLAGDRLWVGFGSDLNGGMGYLDLKTRTFIGMTPELSTNSIGLQNPQVQKLNRNQAPRAAVHGLFQNGREGVWACSHEYALQYFSFTNNRWNSPPTPNASFLNCIAVNSDCMALGGVGGQGGLWLMHQSPLTFGDVPITRYLTHARSPLGAAVISLALDGDHLWVGGIRFVGLVNTKTAHLEKIREYDNRTDDDPDVQVTSMQIVGDYVWFAVDEKIYRLPKSGL